MQKLGMLLKYLKMFVQESTVQLHVTREVVDLDWLPGQGECVHESVVQVPVLLLSE